MYILVMNAGSSSQKSSLYQFNDTAPTQPLQPLWEAHGDWTGQKDVAILTIKAHGEQSKQQIPTQSRQTILEEMLKTLWNGKTRVINQPSDIAIVGHRVVHGGAYYRESMIITPEVKERIKQLASFAPLHNPVNLEGIEIVERVLGEQVPQVAVFDTAFHSQLPLASTIYPGPYEWFEQGIRRYGFHGISYQYCTKKAAEILGKDLHTLRMIICHLGNGCSMAAVQNGRSIDTTMGFTPLEGLMMGTRSGTIDPSIILYLEREQGYDAEKLDRVLNKESGLQGISGVSSDMRQLRQAIGEGNERAALAFAIFIHRLQSFLGAMLASLGGVDAIVFTGGIGENDAIMRTETCKAFGFLNLHLDAEKNTGSPVNQDISTEDSVVRVLVVHTEEDWEIASECWQKAQHAYCKVAD